MNTALMVDALHHKGCKFLLTRNFKDLEKTQKAVQKHHQAVAEGRQRKIIVMAIQHDVLPDYTILVTTTFPNEREVEQFGFFPVKKDRANWISIQYRNRKGKEHDNEWSDTTEHTTNYNFLPVSEVHEYLKMAEKMEQIKLIYK
jgi:hypothetical protein